MERASRVFSELIRDLGLEKGMALASIRKKWETLIGEPVSNHTLPFSFQNGQLLIMVDSPEWLHELRYFQNEFTNKLSPFGVRSIRLKLGSVKKPRKRPVPRKAPKRDLSPQEQEFINEVSSEINDTDMRDQIRKAIENSLAYRPEEPS